MIGSLLIANRGEIARRIIRTARRLGVRTVAVFSDVDAASPHVREAEAAVRIGPAPAAQSYLSKEAILAAARETGAEAIHPGYGFLSENADFAEAVIAEGLVWVGPPPAAIWAMGLKDAAKVLMAGAGVPVTPGYHGEDQSDARLAAEAEAIGFPVLIKAVAGGGGKGMRKVGAPKDFPAALAAARREAAAAFGDDRVLLETYVPRPRHIEVQVFGDGHGNLVHLFERDCSLQRRHQKVVEEAPAPGMDEATRAAVCESALKAARAVGYQGAGTVEFIADASRGLRADRIWFMEMNTRLQVEHPVTEAITGLDLVEWQLRVASGEPLPLRQDEIRKSGWAVEARLYAENPAKSFLPSTGRLKHFRLPGEVRIDAGVEEGGEITPYYDPMIAKLVAWAPTRETAAAKLAEACRSVEVWPVKTNAGFLARALDHPRFRAGEVDTGLIEAEAALLTARTPSPAVARAGLRLAPSPALFGFRLNGPAAVVTVEALVDGATTSVTLDPALAPAALTVVGSDPAVVFEAGEAYEVRRTGRTGRRGAEGASDGSIRSPMPGRIVSVDVVPGASVKRGQPLLVLEAMKMEHVLAAPFDGRVETLAAEPGRQVEEGVELVRIGAG